MSTLPIAYLLHMISFPNNETVPFNLDSKYRNIQSQSVEADGYVISAYDSFVGKDVCIKKIKDIKTNIKMKQKLRDLILSRLFDSHENMLSVVDIMTFPQNMLIFEELYIVTSSYDASLDYLMKSNQLKDLTQEHIQFCLYQILRGLKYIHSSGVIHNNLQMSNVVMNSSCDTFISDFMTSGCNKSENLWSPTNPLVLTHNQYNHIAPELLCQSHIYDKSVDMWSAGCIFASLLSRSVNDFFQGTTPEEVLTSIVHKFSYETFRHSVADACYHDTHILHSTLHQYPQQQSNINIRDSNALVNSFPSDTSYMAIDLLKQMLHLNPLYRITAEEALNHPFLARYHNNAIEPRYSQNINNTNDSSSTTPSSVQMTVYDSIPSALHNKHSTKLLPSGRGAAGPGHHTQAMTFSQVTKAELPQPLDLGSVRNNVRKNNNQQHNNYPPAYRNKDDTAITNCSDSLSQISQTTTPASATGTGTGAAGFIEDEITTVDAKMVLFNEMSRYRPLYKDIRLFLSLDNSNPSQLAALLSNKSNTSTNAMDSHNNNKRGYDSVISQQLHSALRTEIEATTNNNKRIRVNQNQSQSFSNSNDNNERLAHLFSDTYESSAYATATATQPLPPHQSQIQLQQMDNYSSVMRSDSDSGMQRSQSQASSNTNYIPNGFNNHHHHPSTNTMNTNNTSYPPHMSYSQSQSQSQTQRSREEVVVGPSMTYNLIDMTLPTEKYHAAAYQHRQQPYSAGQQQQQHEYTHAHLSAVQGLTTESNKMFGHTGGRPGISVSANLQSVGPGISYSYAYPPVDNMSFINLLPPPPSPINLSSSHDNNNHHQHNMQSHSQQSPRVVMDVAQMSARDHMNSNNVNNNSHVDIKPNDMNTLNSSHHHNYHPHTPTPIMTKLEPPAPSLAARNSKSVLTRKLLSNSTTDLTLTSSDRHQHVSAPTPVSAPVTVPPVVISNPRHRELLEGIIFNNFVNSQRLEYAAKTRGSSTNATNNDTVPSPMSTSNSTTLAAAVAVIESMQAQSKSQVHIHIHIQ